MFSRTNNDKTRAPSVGPAPSRDFFTDTTRSSLSRDPLAPVVHHSYALRSLTRSSKSSYFDPLPARTPAADSSASTTMKSLSSHLMTQPASLSVSRGFRNLGNTCYMNAVLQSLLHIREFVADIRKDSSSGSIAWHLSNLSDEIGKSEVSLPAVDPSEFKRAMSKVIPGLWGGYDQQDALEFLLAVLDCVDEEKKTNSVDLLRGTFLSRIRCSNCFQVSTRSDPFTTLCLPLMTADSAMSISALIRSFCSNERVPYRCERCQVSGESDKQTSVENWPAVLVIALKRFRWERGRSEKNKVLVQCPMQVDLGCAYSLQATVEHRGSSVNSGHYTAHVFDGRNWYLCDDNRISKVKPDEVVSSDTYMLFYRKSHIIM